MSKLNLLLQNIIDKFKPNDLQQTVQELEGIRVELAGLLHVLSEENSYLKKKIAEQENRPEIKQISTPDFEEVKSDNKVLNSEMNLYHEENQLILNNMFRVQEELERQLIENTQLRIKNQEFESRLGKLKQKYPFLLEYESISVIAFDQSCDEPYIDFEIASPIIDGQNLTNLKFKFFINELGSGIQLVSRSKSESLSKAYKFIPKIISTDKAAYRNFFKLRTRDWNVYLFLAQLIKSFSETEIKYTDTHQVDDLFWAPFFKKFIKNFDELPNVFRFNDVELKHQQVNIDYEHIWFELRNVMFGSIKLPTFELRLGAANLNQEYFSKHPKLEIPLIGNLDKPFESWFAESNDDFGEKFELRFDLQAQRFDTKVWSRLSTEDAQLIIGLILVLPIILSRLDKASELNHSIKEWVKLATGMYDLLRLRLLGKRS